DVQAEAAAQALPVDRPHGALLHRDRAAHGVRRRRECRRLSVAQPLELLAAARRERVRQHAVMALEDALGSLVTQTLHQDGRVDDVGEEDGRDRRGHAASSFATCSARAVAPISANSRCASRSSRWWGAGAPKPRASAARWTGTWGVNTRASVASITSPASRRSASTREPAGAPSVAISTCARASRARISYILMTRSRAR